ncbi:MAG: hypothetical protein R6V84_15975 [Desulfobacterales bacterium]
MGRADHWAARRAIVVGKRAFFRGPDAQTIDKIASILCRVDEPAVLKPTARRLFYTEQHFHNFMIEDHNVIAQNPLLPKSCDAMRFFLSVSFQQRHATCKIIASCAPNLYYFGKLLIKNKILKKTRRCNRPGGAATINQDSSEVVGEYEHSVSATNHLDFLG